MANNTMQMADSAKILIVDEDILNIANISQTLVRGGFVISHATSHERALKAVTHERPDLIICNLDAPAIDADEFVRTVKQKAALKGIPFLFIVGAHNASTLAPEILGPRQYLSIPFTREQVFAAVLEHLKHRRPHHSS